MILHMFPAAITSQDSTSFSGFAECLSRSRGRRPAACPMRLGVGSAPGSPKGHKMVRRCKIVSIGGGVPVNHIVNL